jgi:hypothetical protein
MKIKLLLLLSVCFLFSECSLEKQSNKYDIKKFNHGKYALNIENDSCSIKIRELDRRIIRSFKNGFYQSPFLRIDAELISLKELISLTLGVDTLSVILNDNCLNFKYYSAFVDQKITNELADSLIRSKIINALSLDIDKEFIEVDTTIVSFEDKMRHLGYLSEQKNEKNTTSTYSDVIISSGSDCIKGSMTFENYEIGDIISKIGEGLDKALVFSTEESERINYSLKFNDWESLKEKIGTDLGLAFNTHKTQIEQYSVKIKN